MHIYIMVLSFTTCFLVVLLLVLVDSIRGKADARSRDEDEEKHERPGAIQREKDLDTPTRARINSASSNIIVSSDRRYALPLKSRVFFPARLGAREHVAQLEQHSEPYSFVMNHVSCDDAGGHQGAQELLLARKGDVYMSMSPATSDRPSKPTTGKVHLLGEDVTAFQTNLPFLFPPSSATKAATHDKRLDSLVYIEIEILEVPAKTVAFVVGMTSKPFKSGRIPGKYPYSLGLDIQKGLFRQCTHDRIHRERTRMCFEVPSTVGLVVDYSHWLGCFMLNGRPCCRFSLEGFPKGVDYFPTVAMTGKGCRWKVHWTSDRFVWANGHDLDPGWRFHCGRRDEKAVTSTCLGHGRGSAGGSGRGTPSLPWFEPSAIQQPLSVARFGATDLTRPPLYPLTTSQHSDMLV